MKLHRFNKIIVSLLISTFFLSSCMSYKAIKGDTDYILKQKLVAGNKIKITRSDGKVEELIYVDITDDEILITKFFYSRSGHKIYREVRIPFDQIIKIEKKEFDGSKTAGLIIGVGLVGFIVLNRNETKKSSIDSGCIGAAMVQGFCSQIVDIKFSRHRPYHIPPLG